MAYLDYIIAMVFMFSAIHMERTMEVSIGEGLRRIATDL
jgi:hypothetical protein